MDSSYPTREERLKAVTDKLEAGVTELFEGGRFADYLRTMSKFHRYSFGNVILIAMQFPGATQVAGFHDWRRKFDRHVKKGEKGIQILAPCSFRSATDTSSSPSPGTVLVKLESSFISQNTCFSSAFLYHPW